MKESLRNLKLYRHDPKAWRNFIVMEIQEYVAPIRPGLVAMSFVLRDELACVVGNRRAAERIYETLRQICSGCTYRSVTGELKIDRFLVAARFEREFPGLNSGARIVQGRLVTR